MAASGALRFRTDFPRPAAGALRADGLRLRLPDYGERPDLLRQSQPGASLRVSLQLEVPHQLPDVSGRPAVGCGMAAPDRWQW